MLSTLSSNVILAKARAMFGRRLREEDYEAMIKCRTVGELAAYLKKNTRYAEPLATVNETTVHRGYLEVLLRRQLFHDYASLCRYELSVGEHFSDYIIEKGEIEQIIHCLRLLGAGRAHEYLFSLPVFYTRYMRFDLFALSKVNTYEELLAVLKGTPYASILAHFTPEPGRLPDFTAIENALYTHFYQSVYDIIDRHAPRSTRSELRELFGGLIDLQNISHILRLKRYYAAGPDYIRSVLLPFRYRLSQKQLEALLAAPTAQEALRTLRDSAYGKLLGEFSAETIDDAAGRMNFAHCLRKLRFSTHPSVVMLSYLALTEIELDNVTNIIEGIRYQLSPKEIGGMLVGFHNPQKG